MRIFFKKFSNSSAAEQFAVNSASNKCELTQFGKRDVLFAKLFTQYKNTVLGKLYLIFKITKGTMKVRIFFFNQYIILFSGKLYKPDN